MDPIYISLVILRFVLVLVPQYGYIHPDEFFQTTEVVAGDVFDIEVNKPWEFGSFPIRSVSLVYLLYGLPLKLLKMVGLIFPSLISGYTLLIIPRLITALLSLTLDYTLYKLCKCFSVNKKYCLQLMASSYVMLTYMTRTFTNSIESFLFAGLLLLVFTDHNIYLYLKTNFDDDENDHLERVSMTNYCSRKKCQDKYKRSLNKFSFGKAFIIGIIGIAGMYNRPTFALFALGPALLYCEAKQKRILLHSFFIGMGAMCSMIVLTLVDTVYFGESFHEIRRRCDSEKSSFTVCYLTSFLNWIIITPYNFFLYNSNPFHLSEHGIHPRYLHFTVNMTLLFGPLMFSFYNKLFRLFLVTVKKKKFDKSYFPLLMVIVPVFFLSVFPHQEPRFLIPILPLMVLIGIQHVDKHFKFKQIFVIVWFIFNLLLIFVYGFLHQGGVIQSLLHLQNQIDNKGSRDTPLFSSHDKFVYFHTYMPPHSLLLSNKAKSQILDMHGGSVDYFRRYLNQKLSQDDSFHSEPTNNVYVITPSTVVSEFEKNGINFTTISVYHGHLSMEDPPNVMSTYRNSKKSRNVISNAYNFVCELLEAFTLHVVHLPQDQLSSSKAKDHNVS